MTDQDFPVTPGAVILPVLAMITLIIDIPPLVWHIRNRNLAATSLVVWVMIPNMFSFINPLIWPTDNTAVWWSGVGLCDIEVRLLSALNYGFIGSLLCIMRSLARVLDTNRTVVTSGQAEHRKQRLIECIFCIGAPIYGTMAHYTVQYDRYFIYAISGCTPSIKNSWLAIALFLVWPSFLCLGVVYYSSMFDLCPLNSGRWLTSTRLSHCADAQISRGFRLSPQRLKFQFDQVSLLTPIHLIVDSHYYHASNSTSRPVQECNITHEQSLHLEWCSWRFLEFSSVDTYCRICPLRPLATARRRLCFISLLWAWRRCAEDVLEGTPQNWVRTALFLLTSRAT